MEKTDTNKKDFKKRLVVRFIYRMSATPSCDIIEMDYDTWKQFLNLESMTNRINMILEILDRFLWMIIWNWSYTRNKKLYVLAYFMARSL